MSPLSRIHKIAFARVITDLIEADFVVEADEMQFFEKVISKEGFSISDAMLIEAKKIDLAKALSILKGLDIDSRKLIIDILKQLAMSDGVCVPLEAILIFSVEQVLLYDATVHSIPYSGFNIDNLKVIYIENEKNDLSRQIEAKLFAISNGFKLAGFDFVYVPHIIQDFRMMEKSYLEKVVKYMIPSISIDKVSTICDNLRDLDTSSFCRDLLYKKLGINLIDCKPSLLIKINDSDIVDKYDSEDAERIRFSNFLQLELKEDVMDEINAIIESYMSMISCSIIVENRPRTPKFIYTGFHRSLFDLIAFGHESKEYHLVFDIKAHKASIYFESMNDDNERIVLKLNPQEAVLYLMIVKKSLEGEGLDWREHIPAKDKRIILNEYNQIYSQIGKANTVNEYKDRTQVHHIKNRIKTLRSIANADMFIPKYVKNGNDSFYKVKANSHYVTIKINTTL